MRLLSGIPICRQGSRDWFRDARQRRVFDWGSQPTMSTATFRTKPLFYIHTTSRRWDISFSSAEWDLAVAVAFVRRNMAPGASRNKPRSARKNGYGQIIHKSPLLTELH